MKNIVYLCSNKNDKEMKKLIIVALSALTIGFGSCNTTPTATAQNRVTVSQPAPSDINVESANVPGFNVGEFANLLKTTKDPNAIEQAINAPNNTINNLDLNGDGNIDYVKVVEGANNTLTVIDETSATQSVTVATLTVNQQTQTMQVAGNQAYCGDNYMYSSHYTLGDYLFMSYLLHPHRYYVPMYHYGYYPRYYHPYRSYYGYGYSRPYYRQSYSATRYRTSNGSYRSVPSSTYRSTTTSAPRQTYRATTPTRTSVSAPVRSQRSFQPRNTSTPVRSGGFGSSRSSSPSRSSSSSSRSSFGGGRSSFGGGGRRR